MPDVITCPSCNRNNGVRRTSCLYCGAPLPVTETSAALQVPTLRPVEEWEKGFDLTLMSTVRLCKAALPHLKQSEQGRIVVITSTSVREPIATLILSSAFRTAVVQTLKTMSGELAPHGVTVNNIAPGRFLTDRVRQLDGAAAAKEGISQEEYTERNVKATIPMGRIGDPAEFGATCAFVCSKHASFMTGQTIVVDGGQTKGVY